MGSDTFCSGLGSCLSSTLTADEVTKNINKFFKNLIIRGLKLEEIKEKIVNLLFSRKFFDFDSWKNLLKENILNSEAVQTSNKVVEKAVSDAKEIYNDSTLPFIALFLLSTSNLNIFIEAFKYLNLAKCGIDTVKDVKGSIENVANSTKGKSILSGIVAGIQTGIETISKANELVKQAIDPNMVKKDYLKSLISYYVYFITILPVDIIDEFGEFGEVYSNITSILNSSFDKKFRDEFVENTIFKNFQDETINATNFFNETYEKLKNDTQIRIMMVQSYIQTLNPLDDLLKPLSDINKSIKKGLNDLNNNMTNMMNNMNNNLTLRVNNMNNENPNVNNEVNNEINNDNADKNEDNKIKADTNNNEQNN